jgi:hypothetical protein
MIRFLLWTALALFLSLALSDVLWGEEPCGNDCTGWVWELQIAMTPVLGLEFDSEEECIAAANELEYQIPPFTPVACAEVGVKRQSL